MKSRHSKQLRQAFCTHCHLPSLVFKGQRNTSLGKKKREGKNIGKLQCTPWACLRTMSAKHKGSSKRTHRIPSIWMANAVEMTYHTLIVSGNLSQRAELSYPTCYRAARRCTALVPNCFQAYHTCR